MRHTDKEREKKKYMSIINKNVHNEDNLKTFKKSEMCYLYSCWFRIAVFENV